MAGLVLDGTNWAQTPDDATLDITGDIDIRASLALDDWTPVSTQDVLTKYDGTSDAVASYGFEILSSGKLRLFWDNGSLLNFLDSSVAPTVSDGADLAIRATLDVDNGSGQSEVKFYTKATTPSGGLADVSSNSGWTQLGTTVTQAGTTSINASTTVLIVGAHLTGGTLLSALKGKVYAAVVKNGISGTEVTDPDFFANAFNFSDAAGRPWGFYGGDVAVGIAAETDEALALTSETTDDSVIGVGLALETDIALGLAAISNGSEESTFTGREHRITLGCGGYRVLLTERGGGHPIDFLPFTDLSWGRIVDDVSSASITVPTGGAEALETCCTALTRSDSFDGEVDSWSHEISIYRDDDLVWVGPIVGMTYTFQHVQIECRDLFAWFDKRVLPTSRAIIGDLAALFELFAHDALDQEPSPNIIIQPFAVNTINERTVRREDYILAGNFLRALGKDGVDFTMLGRRLIEGNLDGVATDMGVALQLPQQAARSASLEKRGTDLATQVTLTGRPPGGSAKTIAATVGGINEKYGLVQVQQAESFITLQAFLANAAVARLEMLKTPPRYLDVVLDPKAPFTINQLVCGFLIDVKLQVGCANVIEMMRVHSLTVTVSVTDNGEVTENPELTLVPKGQPGLGLGFDLGFA